LSHTPAHSAKAIGPLYDGRDPDRLSARGQRRDGRLTGPRCVGGRRSAGRARLGTLLASEPGQIRPEAERAPVEAARIGGWGLRMRAGHAKAAGWFVNRRPRILPGHRIVQARTTSAAVASHGPLASVRYTSTDRCLSLQLAALFVVQHARTPAWPDCASPYTCTHVPRSRGSGSR
jgi:hypothetical protein